MLITIFLLIITIGVLCFFISNLLVQNEQMENEIKKFNKREEKMYNEVENYYKVFLALFTEAYSNMQRVDKRGSFSSDDEVGFAFKVLYSAIQEVQTKLESFKKSNDEEA